MQADGMQHHHPSSMDQWSGQASHGDAGQSTWYQPSMGHPQVADLQQQHQQHPYFQQQSPSPPQQEQAYPYPLQDQQAQQQRQPSHQQLVQHHMPPQSPLSHEEQQQRQQQQYQLYLMQQHHEMHLRQQQQQQHQQHEQEPMPVGTTFDSVIDSYMSQSSMSPPQGVPGAQGGPSLQPSTSSTPPDQASFAMWSSAQPNGYAMSPSSESQGQSQSKSKSTSKMVQDESPLFLRPSGSSLSSALEFAPSSDGPGYDPNTVIQLQALQHVQQQQPQSHRQPTHSQQQQPQLDQTLQQKSVNATAGAAAAPTARLPSPSSQQQVESSGGSSLDTAMADNKHKARTLANVRGVSMSVARHDDLQAKNPIYVGPEDDSSEPGTPPLLPTKAQAPSGRAAAVVAATSTASARKRAAVAAAVPAKVAPGALISKARTLLTPTLVEKDPSNAARELIALLSVVDEDKKFRSPRTVNAKDRMELVEKMAMEGVSERACSKASRRTYYGAWVGSAAGRNIIASWLKQAIPPKSSGIPDYSGEYGRTLLPLLTILKLAPIKLEHLRDEVSLGKLIAAVNKRARSTVAQELALTVKNQWTQLVTGAPAAAAASTSSAAGTSNKRPAPTTSNGAMAAAAAKKIKSVAAGLPSSSSTAPKSSVAARGSVKPVAAKVGLPFFSTNNSTKPAAAQAKRSATVSGSSVAAKKSGTFGGSARNDVMSFIDTLHRPAAARVEAAKAVAPDGKGKGKKSVRWKDDAELVAVKLIEVAVYADADDEEDDEAVQAHAELVTKGVGALDNEEGTALRQAHIEMEESIDWYTPPEVAFPRGNPERGSESVEARKQEDRTRNHLLVVYEEGKEPPSADAALVTEAASMATPPPELSAESRAMTLGSQVEPFDDIDIDRDDNGAMNGSAAASYRSEGTDVGGALPAAAAASSSTGSAAALPIADLLAKLSGSGVGGTGPLASATSHALQQIGLGVVPNVGEAAGGDASAAIARDPTAAPGLKLDVGMLHSILQNVKAKHGGGTGGESNTTQPPLTAPAVAALPPGPAPNVSALLASLTSTLGPSAGQHAAAAPQQQQHQSYRSPPPAAISAYDKQYAAEDEGGGYWTRKYRDPKGPVP